MSQYNTGTIAITNGSAAVVGTGTLWNTEAAAGDWLMVLGDGLVYEILSITDDTNLTLTNTFQGSTAATATYVITRDFTPNYGFALMGRADQETAAIYTRAITDIDSALTSYTVGASALEAQHWANNAEGVLVQEGDLVDDYSSLHWSIKAEYWATTTGALVESLDYSAKEFAIGTFVPAGSSKQWASEVEDTIVASGLYSALHYSAKSAISAAAALVSEDNAQDWASTTGTLIESTDYSAREYAIGTFVPAGSSKDWATLTGTTVDGSGYSAMEHAVGTTVPAGSAKDWATLTSGTVDGSLYSAQEWATGVLVAAGSAKDWATLGEDIVVDGGTGYSALHYSAKCISSADLAEDWATLTGAQVAGTDYSSREYAVGTAVGAGSSKQWATELEDTIVTSGLYSALHYAAKADASKTAAETAETNAETAETNAAATYDLFDDRMLGSKTVDPTLDNDSNALVEGAMYWNSTNKVLRIYDGAAFQDTGSATANITEWTATAGQTTFTGTDDNALALAYTAGYLMVFRNGTLLDPDDYTATSGSSVVLDTGADLNDSLNFLGFGTFDIANTYTKTEADATFAPIGRSADNLVINGAFLVWQRDISEAIPAATDAMLADRWNVINSTTAAYVITRNELGAVASDIPATFSHHLNITTADTSIDTGLRCWVECNIEGIDIAPLQIGNSGAHTITLSFWSSHTMTGTHCVCLKNSARTRSYIMEYTQAVADTWEYHTITADLDTAGSWLDDIATVGLRILFAVAVGTNYHGAADTWLGTNGVTTSNQVNNLSSTANLFRLAAVKLEDGSVATDFTQRPFAEELALCQRYYQKSYAYAVVPADGADSKWYGGTVVGVTQIRTTFFYPVVMAKDPVLTYYRSSTGGAAGKWAYWNAATVDSTATATVSASDEVSLTLELTVSGRALGDAYGVLGGWSAEAEI